MKPRSRVTEPAATSSSMARASCPGSRFVRDANSSGWAASPPSARMMLAAAELKGAAEGAGVHQPRTRPDVMPSASRRSDGSRRGWAPSASRRVTARSGRVATGAGNGEDRSAVVQRSVGRDPRPAGQGCFHDDHQIRQRGDDPIPDGEPPPGRRSRRRAARRRGRRAGAPVRTGRRAVGDRRCRGRWPRRRSARPASGRGPVSPSAASAACSAPWWAAPSIPIAIPDTTETPAAPRNAPSSQASASPCTEAARVPTTATRGARKTVGRSPSTKSTAGRWGTSSTIG